MPPPPNQKSARDGIVTTTEVECWRQRLKSEEESMAPVLHESLKKAGPLLDQKNDLLWYYRDKEFKGREFFEFTIDKINSDVPFDAKAKDDTLYPEHVRHKEGLKSNRPIRTSQAYGWYAPIDMPKYGFERTRICQDSFMDKSHLS